MKKIFTPFAVFTALSMSLFSTSVVSARTVICPDDDIYAVSGSTNYAITLNNSDYIYDTVYTGQSRVLKYELVTNVNTIGSFAYSIDVLDESGLKYTYGINSDTLIIDAMTGEPKDYTVINNNEKYYIISDADLDEESISTSSQAQAVIVNMPDNARCPTLHEVVNVYVSDNGAIISLDDGMGDIDLNDNMSIFQMGNPNPLYIAPADVEVGDKALVWSSKSYQSVDTGKHSKPYQMMIVGSAEQYDWQLMGNINAKDLVEEDEIEEVVEEVIEEIVEEKVEEVVVPNGVAVPDIPNELLQNIPDDSVILATPRELTFETVVSTSKNDTGVVEFINSTDGNGITTKYTIDENTLIIDSMTGKVLTLDNVQSGEKLYIYGNSPKPEIEPPINYAQAVLLNIPMGGEVPAMYKVVDIVFGDGKTQIIVDDIDAKKVDLNSNMSVSSLITNDVTGRSGIAIGNRIFVWYEVLYDNTEEIALSDRNVIQMVVAPSLQEDLENDGKVSMPAMIYNNRAYIGLRNVSERIGLDVSWNANTKTTTISSDKRTMDIQVGQTSYLSRPIGENMVGMAMPTELGESFIGIDGTLYVDPMVFEVLGGYIVSMKMPSH